MTKKICISGYYGFDNFGDETILNVLTENLKQFSCNPEITVFSKNPEKTSLLLNVKSINSFDLFKVIKSILSCDCLISGGGSLLQDVTSIKSLIYYIFIIFIAQLFKKKVIIFAQGIGPVNNKILLILTRFILKKADYITVRDKESYNLLSRWNIQCDILSDPVWNISAKNIEKTNKIGIQLRKFKSLDDSFLNELSLCINKFFSKKEICILSLQNKMDLDVCNALKDKLTKINPDIKVQVIENTSNAKVISDIASYSEIIAMRYHACLIAIKNGVKLLPLSYDIKVVQLAEEFNIKYIDINHCEKMKEIFEQFIGTEIKYDKEKIENLRFDFKKIEKVL